MIAALRALPFLWKVVTLLGVLSAAGGAVWAIYAHIRAEGYRAGYAVAEAECEAEKRAQAVANRNAIDQANRRLLEMADQLVLKELQVDDYVKAIDLASAEDPDSGELCLLPPSVRRLNTLR